MSFTIHSIGESEFLEQILISVAMISGSGDMAKLAMIGGLLGVVIVMVQSLFQGAKQINFQHILLGWIMYASMFGPTTTILIEDAYTGHVKVVDNVPFSVGVAGGVISKVGYGLKNLFEQGFGVISPGDTSRRYTESLELLNSLHKASNNSAIFDVINDQIGPAADFRGSWDNYIRDCTLAKIDLGEESPDYIAHAKISDALKFTSNIYHTEVYLPNREILTCTEAFDKLDGVTGTFVDGSNAAVRHAMNSIMGYNTANQVYKEVPPLDKTNAAVQSLFQFTNDSYSFVKTSMLEPIYMEAVAGRYQDVRDFSAAIMVNQAVSQRNFQWAAEQSLFMTVARPLMAFFEGFIYAVTPVMAFLIMLGGVGLTLAMKYMQSLLWIQLWMPTLAVVNLYIHSAASSELMAKVGYSTNSLNSMYGLNTAVDIISSWIATGGMLAAATPVISMFFVTGSSYAFANIAQRVGGADHIDEKQMSPDIAKVGSVMAMDNAYKGNTVTGMHKAGAEGSFENISFGDTISSGISAAQSNTETKMEAFQKTLQNARQKAYENGTGSSFDQSLVESLGARNDASINATMAAIKTYGENNGWTGQEINAAIASFAAGIKASAGGRRGQPVSGEAGTTFSNTSQTSAGDNAAHLTQLADSANLSESDLSALSSGLVSSYGSTGSKTFTVGMSDTDAESISSTASEAIQAQRTQAEIDQITSAGGINTQQKANEWAAHIQKQKGAAEALHKMVANGPDSLKQAAAQRIEHFQRQGMNAHQATIAGNFAAALSRGVYGGDDSAFAENFNALSKMASGQYGDYGDATANQDIPTANPDIGGAGNLQGVEGVDRNMIQGAANMPHTNEDAVRAQHGSNVDETHDESAAQDSAIFRQHAVDALDRVVNKYKVGGIPAGLGQGLTLGNALDKAMSEAGVYADAGLREMHKLMGGGRATLEYALQNSGFNTLEEFQESLYKANYTYARNNLGLSESQSHYYSTVASVYDKETQYQASQDMMVETQMRANALGVTHHSSHEYNRAFSNAIAEAAHYGSTSGGGGLKDIRDFNLSSEKLTGGVAVADGDGKNVKTIPGR